MRKDDIWSFFSAPYQLRISRLGPSGASETLLLRGDML